MDAHSATYPPYNYIFASCLFFAQLGDIVITAVNDRHSAFF